MKVRRTRTRSSSRLSDISVLLGGGRRHGTKTVAMLELVIRFSVHLNEEENRNTTWALTPPPTGAVWVDIKTKCPDSWGQCHLWPLTPPPSFIPLGHSREEVEEVMQTGGVSGREQTGQQLEGGRLVLHGRQRLGLEQGSVELGGNRGSGSSLQNCLMSVATS